MAKKGRKLILVRNDLLEHAIEITAKEGRTLFSFTNEIFEQAVKAHEMSVKLRDVLEFYTMMNICKNIGYVVVPYDVLKNITKKLYAKERKNMLKEWRDSGLWTGNYFKVKFNDNPLEKVKNFLESIVWNIGEFSMSVNSNTVNVKCFSSNLDEEYTEMLAKFIEGIFAPFNYAVKKNKCLRGIIMMELESQEKVDNKLKLEMDVKN